LSKKLPAAENLEKIKPEIEKHVDDFLNHKLREMFLILSKFIGIKTTKELKAAFLIELETIFPVMINRYMVQLKSDIDLKKIVIEKVDGFSGKKRESILKQITKKELHFLKLTELYSTV